MHDTTPRTAAGKVLWHFSMSLDGFVAGPGHSMDWMPEATNRSALVEEYIQTTGAVRHQPACTSAATASETHSSCAGSTRARSWQATSDGVVNRSR